MDTWQVSNGTYRHPENVVADFLEVRADGRLIFANWTGAPRQPYAVVRIIGPVAYSDVIRLDPAGVRVEPGA